MELEVQAQVAPPALIFNWPRRDDARQYVVRRKNASDQIWKTTVATLPGDSTGFADQNVSAGVPYEYEVQLETGVPAPEGGFISAYTYASAGIDIPEKDRKGKVLLVVDSSVVNALATELEMFRADLLGAGWSVKQREVSRTSAVTDVKNMIRGEYNADASTVRSVVLIGHVPVPYSGNIAPDMHSSHRGAWPADVFYADMDGVWTDSSVSVRGEDREENDNFPGDGKFDQSVIPSPAELEIGRIDFWEMSEFQGRNEVDLLRTYFRKNHAFRHRQFTAARQGLVHDNFGDLDGDAPAVDAWRHFSLFFRANRVREVGPGEFFNALNSDSYLWAYGCGGGGIDKADGVGSTADFAANDPKAVFLILHGSYFGDWNYPNNFLRAGIATPNYTLASIWSGLPHWFMHHMALGETVGYSTRLTQNNLSLYRSFRNFSPGEAHISLIGDPTLEMFPVIPPSSLSASANAAVQLQWSPSPDENILGYHVYYATAADGSYERLTQQPIAAAGFLHPVGAGVHYYMVRAVKLERTGSGTFRNLSQGIFTSVSKSSGPISTPPLVTVVTEDADANEFRANSGSFKFVRDGVDGSPLTIEFTLGGIAQNGIDYSSVSESITIPGSQNSVTLAIYPRSDNSIEGDETVTVQLKSGSTYRVGSPESASFVIRDHVVNTAPVATPQEIVLEEDQPATVTLGGQDADGNSLTYAVLSNPAHGTLSGNAPLLVYEPAANSFGQDSFTFAVSDGIQQSAPATVSITVTPGNDPPQAEEDLFQATEHGITLNAADLLANDFDPDGDTLSIADVAARSEHGGTVIFAAGMISYQPPSGYIGLDSFIYTLRDSNATQATGLVRLDVLLQPVIRSLRPSQGGLLITFEAAPSALVSVEVSSDTVHWQTLGSVRADATGRGEFLDSVPVSAAMKLYRLEWVR